MLRRVFSEEEEKLVYKILAGLFLAAFVAFVALKALHFQPTTAFRPCIVRRILGIYCPGCGMSRAAEAMLAFQPLRAFLYHPFLVSASVFLLIYIVGNAAGRLYLHRPFLIPIRSIYLWIGFGLLVGNWILRNVLWFCFGIPIS